MSFASRKKDKLGPFAGLSRYTAEGDERVTMSIIGIQCTIFEDPDGQITEALERNLLHWGSDKKALVDRFDARLLLGDVPTPAPSRQLPCITDDADEEELDEERYADMDYSREAALLHPWSGGAPAPAAEQQGTSAEAAAVPDGDAGSRDGSFSAVGFSYSAEGVGTGAATETEPGEYGDGAAYDPGFPVPMHLSPLLRGVTERSHNIMVQTAKFVRESGGHSELVLRVRQAANPNFAFLRPDDPRHPYFCWLVTADPQDVVHDSREGESGATGHGPDLAEKDADVAASQNALAMLSEYGSQHAESPRDHVGDLGPDQALPPFRTEPPAAAGATDLAPTTSPTEDAAATVMGPENAEVVIAAGAEDAAASGLTTGIEEVRQIGQGAQQQRAEPEEARGTGEPEQAGPRHGTPPEDVQAIMAKLVGFVKKNGVKFEASVRKRERNNPRFAFLKPDNEHHGYYRQLLGEALGAEAAQQVIDAMPAAAPAPDLAPASVRNLAAPNLAAPANATGTAAGAAEPKQDAAAACASMDEPKEAAAGEPTEDGAAAAAEAVALGATVEMDAGTGARVAKTGPKQSRKRAGGGPAFAIQANPSVAKLAIVRRQKASEALEEQGHDRDNLDGGSDALPDDARAGKSGDNHSPGSSPEREGTPAEGEEEEELSHGVAGARARAADAELARAWQSGRGVESAVAAAAAADAAKAADALKAERRRLAAQLLASRRAAAAQLLAPEPPPTSNAIANHRLALLAEDGDAIGPEEEPEAGELPAGRSATSAAAGAPIQAAVQQPSLPKLEDILRPRVIRSASPSDDSPADSSHESEGTPDTHRSRRHRSGERSRSGRRGSPARQPERERGSRRPERSRRRSRSRSRTSSRDRRDSRRESGRKVSSQRSRSRSRERSYKRGEASDKKERRKETRTHGRSRDDDVSGSRKRRERREEETREAPKKVRKHKEHDWGIEARQKETPQPPAEARKAPSVPISEVPDALRARIKALLAQK
ncbi:probable splicing factor, suppressor of white-apricot homolog at N-terminal half [Coccomyxa sp. Obi]|nr:probable splicing factor, suppressor of white-apricot homolog at N-terminal half [Coccomyxa sp. Obi]